MKKYDYLIVGQGLAGTILGYTLLSKGKKIKIIDKSQKHSSSKVAAGIYNPIVFKRLTKSWNVDQLLPFAQNFYRNLELFLNINFHQSMEVSRIFANKHQKEEWIKKSKDPSFTSYLEIGNKELPNIVENNAPEGHGTVINAGKINTYLLLNEFRNILNRQKLLIDEQLCFDDLISTKNKITFRGEEYSKVIFCEGFLGANNPFFNFLPYSLTKGEVLTLEIPGLNLKSILSKGVFLMSLGDDKFKLGSTFNWTEANNIPSEKGKNELLEKFSKIYDGPFKILDHQAAVRPTVKDRRPFIGLHPHNPSLGIFNGLGSKGLLLAPFFANQYAEFLDGKAKLNKEVNISRFLNK